MVWGNTTPQEAEYFKFKVLDGSEVSEMLFYTGDNSSVIIYVISIPKLDNTFYVVAFNDSSNETIWGADASIYWALRQAIEKWDELAQNEKDKINNPFKQVLSKLLKGGS